MIRDSVGNDQALILVEIFVEELKKTTKLSASTFYMPRFESGATPISKRCYLLLRDM
jgi:hypothetical protein